MTYRYPFFILATLLSLALAQGASAGTFSLAFDWSGLKPCTSGYPNRVASPVFDLGNVPAGTRFIRFRLRDLDAPGYDHGGGLVRWDGTGRIARGAFTYQSPCPPNGSHRYRWTATALKSRSGGVLATATAEADYP